MSPVSSICKIYFPPPMIPFHLDWSTCFGDLHPAMWGFPWLEACELKRQPTCTQHTQHRNVRHRWMATVDFPIQNTLSSTSHAVKNVVSLIGQRILPLLDEVIERMWLPVDPWAGPWQLEAPHPFPRPGNVHSAHCSHTRSYFKDAVLRE